ncbi:MAG: hypothetical protein AAF675_15330 [Pseudomonadota bacterium]
MVRNAGGSGKKGCGATGAAPSRLRVPIVSHARLAPRRDRPPVAPDGLHPTVSALLARQQAWRRARAEERSLSPPYLAAVERRFAAERAAERALARGRDITREEIRRACDRRRPSVDHGMAEFPPNRPFWHSLIAPLAVGMLPVLLPFGAFFALTFVIG